MRCYSASKLAALVLLAARAAWAQDVPPEIELLEPEATEEPRGPSAIDLQNIVTSAAKNVTTIQEAPAIVTVVTQADIERWGYRTLADALIDIPGWGYYAGLGEQVPALTVRGQQTSLLYLVDGMVMTGPTQLQIEAIKRVEVITGPGGVLWGANSFLGIINVVTKDANDLDGVEVGAQYADGRGDATDLRAYAMAGGTLWGGRIKAFVHGSYQSYQGQLIESRQVIAVSLVPQPTGSALFGNSQVSDQPRSMVYNVDGKLVAGPLSLNWLWSGGEMHWGGTYPLGIVQQNVPPELPWGPNATNDPNRTGHDAQATFLTNYAGLAYRDHFGRAGLDMRAYYVQSRTDIPQLELVAPSRLVKGGVVVDGSTLSNRAAYAIDGHLALPLSNRLVFGGEVFYEWLDQANYRFLSPELGASSSFTCPHAGDGMSFLPNCPVVWILPSSRYVGGVFASDQWRVWKTLTLDVGARFQKGFGDQPHDGQMLYSGTLVWNFLPKWHFKANYSQGFRPPILWATNLNGNAVSAGTAPHLENELSEALQAEVNARVLRNVGRIREATLRADYSYSVLSNVISLQNGLLGNSGTVAMSSAEFLGRLYLRGDHTVQLGYTWLHSFDSERGTIRSLPNHWFTLDGQFRLVTDRLDAVTTLWLGGSASDVNRLPVPDLGNCVPDRMPAPANCGAVATASHLTLDRIPAVALWSIGLRWRDVLPNLDLNAFAYNVLDQHYYLYDIPYDLLPSGEMLPYPGIGRRLVVSARYRY